MSADAETSSIGDAAAANGSSTFSEYQKFVVALLAFLQFSIVMDFMIISPLGAIIMPDLAIGPQRFGEIVSAYAFSAGFSGLLAAGFADKFDRKRFLLFFYVGFILGTALCALAPNYPALLLARIVTGIFGGVIGSIVLAIATDLFPLQMRGRVMGVVQTAFSASQVLGVPAGIYLANIWSWHVAFMALVVVATPIGFVILLFMRPVSAHLALKQETSPWAHLVDTVVVPKHLLAFAATALLVTGGYMLMPFGSVYTVNNLGIPLAELPTVYFASGFFTILTGPVVGRASDAFGKFNTFIFGCALSILMVLIYTHLGHVSLFVVIAVSVLMFVGIFSRIIPSQALMSAIPEPAKRGSFNAINASMQQMAGGVASVVAGMLVVQAPDGSLKHFDWLGYVVVATTLLSLYLMYFIQRAVTQAAR
ncbi:MAG TPA: MFS transporter [Xanthobacteraceae bacterium]|jgi:predicted MFS family arabinose efflux permease|nr:MFS transporter [Xanthobacteraceae bacterium]